MALPERLRLIGATASPYTRKMVALLRYRRINYSILWGEPANVLDKLGIAKPKMTFHPTVLFEDAAGEVEAVCDSTPIIRRLEAERVERSVLPGDPALAFVDFLLEDFADEWCTKYMFHYRWFPEEDADNAGTLLPLCMDITLAPAALAQFKQFFSERQISRLHVVGSNEVTAPIIDDSYRRFLTALEAHFAQQPFLLGKRPAASDFALFGQLSQLVGFDPSSRRIAHELSPRTVAWVSLMEDQGGLEPRAEDWNDIASLPESLNGIVQEIGRGYAPALLANARAHRAGEKTWEADIDGSVWTQQTFAYQVKCLQWIREQYAALSAPDRARVDTLMAGSGCEVLWTEKQL